MSTTGKKKMSKGKIILIIIGVILVFGIIGAAMGDGDAENSNEDPAQTTIDGDTQTDKSKNILLDSEIIVEKVGDSDTSANYAYILISQSNMDNLTGEDLTEFVENKVKGSEYNWFSIISDEGNVIYFPLGYMGSESQSIDSASYGPEDTTVPGRGLPKDIVGYWKINDSKTFEYQIAE